jgi:hypothetical protein
MAIRSYGQGGGKLVALGTVAQKTCFLSLLTCLPIGFLWLHAEGPLSFFLRDQHVAQVAGLYLKWLVLALVSAAGLYPATQYLRIQVRESRLEKKYFESAEQRGSLWYQGGASVQVLHLKWLECVLVSSMSSILGSVLLDQSEEG